MARREEDAAIGPVRDGAARHRDPRLWDMLGLLHRGLDEIAPAIEAFDRAAALSPDDAGIACRRASAHLEAGRPAAALFEAALALAPADDTARLGRISALRAERGIAAAIEALTQAVADQPGWLEGQARLANLRWQAGDVRGFAVSLERAVAERPADVALWGALLAAMMQAERCEDTRAAARRGRAAAGGHWLFDAYEAVALDELGRLDEAALLYAAMQPIGEPGAALYHLRHLLRAGRAAEAAALAETWVETPHRALFLSYLAAAWRLAGDSRWAWLEGDERLMGVYDLDLDLDALAAFLRSLHITQAQPLDQSVRGGTQSEGALLVRPEPEMRALRQAIVAAVERHLAQLPAADPAHPVLSPARDRPVRFGASWSVRLAGGGQHANHRHPGGWFSSALYVALPSEAERGPPPAGWLALGAPPAELGLPLRPFREIEPKPGRLVLFPSTMWHGTRPFDAGERLTLAFDVLPPL